MMIDSNDLTSANLPVKSEQIFNSKVRKSVFIVLIILVSLVQLHFFTSIFILVDSDTYSQVTGELLVTPTSRYGFGIGLGGVTWMKTQNTGEAIFFFQFPFIENLTNSAFIDLIGRFWGELFIYYCATLFLFWNPTSILKKSRKGWMQKISIYLALFITWTIVALPLLLFKYSMFRNTIWIPESFTFNTYYYEYSSITYRALIECMMFIPSKLAQGFGFSSDAVYKPFVIYISGVLSLSIVSLLTTITVDSIFDKDDI